MGRGIPGRVPNVGRVGIPGFAPGAVIFGMAAFCMPAPAAPKVVINRGRLLPSRGPGPSSGRLMPMGGAVDFGAAADFAVATAAAEAAVGRPAAAFAEALAADVIEAAASQAPLDSHSSMKASSSVVASSPTVVDLKCWMTYRRLVGVSLASMSFARVRSSFHLATKSAMRRSSAAGPPAAADCGPAGSAALAPGGAGRRGAPGNFTPGLMPPTGPVFGRSEVLTSESGGGYGAPASRACA
mmetsp:Transcript_39755/g.110438  ORF Transcript_39755/g.110438 Transcript_39755/m.110438 type:complete len:241 (+) Transcript_39755:131-853(+)